MDRCATFLQLLVRKKANDLTDTSDTRNRKCLNVFDLIGLGLGSSLGLAVYVICAYVIRNEAGPSTVLSVLLAGVAALFSGMCYCEFSARFPRPGASYDYVYAVVGELSAFVVGWHMILEYMLGAAAAAKAFGHHLDAMLNGTVRKYVESHVTCESGHVLETCPDPLSSSVVLVAAILVILHTKGTSVICAVLGLLSCLLLVCIVCVGFFHVHHENWTGGPGFFAFGTPGIIRGAAILFYAFNGLECVVTALHECKQPLAIHTTAIFAYILVCFSFLFAVTCAVSLSSPWFTLAAVASLPKAFSDLHIGGALYVVAVGGLLGLSSACVALTFSIPRLVATMAQDGLLCRSLASVNSRTRTHVLATILPAVVIMVISFLFKLDILVQILSLGTLLSHSLVAVCVICAHYSPDNLGHVLTRDDDLGFTQSTEFVYSAFPVTLPGNVRMKTGRRDDMTSQMPNYGGLDDFAKQQTIQCQCGRELSRDLQPPTAITPLVPLQGTKGGLKVESVVNNSPAGSSCSLLRPGPNHDSLRKVTCTLLVFLLAVSVLALLWRLDVSCILSGSWWRVTLILVCSLMVFACAVYMSKQPQNSTRTHYRVPYVPFVPLVSILVNIFLIASLPVLVWIRFITWLCLGLLIYFGFSIHCSHGNRGSDQEVILTNIEESEDERQS